MSKAKKTSKAIGGSGARAARRPAASSKGLLREQAERFYRTFSALIRAYQFRDREGMTCLGLSVSQCYTLDALERGGPMPMGHLAGAMFLEVSTMTRLVDQLVGKGLVARVQDDRDRRVCRVKISAKGRSLHNHIQADLVSEYERVLASLPGRAREAVIDSIARIHAAFRAREGCAAGGAMKTELQGGRRAAAARGGRDR